MSTRPLLLTAISYASGDLHDGIVVNAAIRKLLKEDIITVDLKEYSIPDKFLWLWVNRQYNNA